MALSETVPRRERAVRTPAGQVLATTEWGPRDGLPIVLLHGLSMTGAQAFAGAPALGRRGFRLVAFDARGHGRSSPAAGGPAGYSYALLTEDLVAVMDACGLERALLVGVSLGAHTATRLTLEDPSRVAGLAVVSPAFDPENHPREDQVKEGHALSAGLRTDGVEGFIDALHVPAGLARRPAALRAAGTLTRRRLESHENLAAVGDAIEGSLISRPFEGFGQLAAIEVPVLVVGTHDELDPRHPFELARSYARALPGSHFECEREGQTPLGWGGRRLTQLIEELAGRAWPAPN